MLYLQATPVAKFSMRLYHNIELIPYVSASIFPLRCARVLWVVGLFSMFQQILTAKFIVLNCFLFSKLHFGLLM